MRPGLYVMCRQIGGGPAAHQFIVLVPERPATLKAVARQVSGIGCVLLGAYEIGGYLKARAFADGDATFFERKVAQGEASDVQADRVELQTCLAVPEDTLLELVYRSFINYRTHEGTRRELRYPSGTTLTETIALQLNPSNFNSNSWAQSIVFWSCMLLGPGKVIQDFNGLDVGNSRLIPKSYFQPRASAG